MDSYFLFLFLLHNWQIMHISFESPGSNRVIITLEQQVDVLEELVRDNRAEVNFTLATNGMVLQMTVNSIVHGQ